MDAGLSAQGARMNETDERCAVCGRGRYRARRVTWMIDSPLPTIVEDVPAKVCDFCGDEVFSAAVAHEMDRLARARPQPVRTVTVPVYHFRLVGAKVAV